MTPCALTRPKPGLIDVMPHAEAGERRLPPVSVPVAAGVMRAPTAAPLPPLEPPGLFVGSHGLEVCGVPTPKANSSVWVWPSRTIPAALRRFQTAQSPRATLPSSTLEEAVSGRPFTA